MQLLHLLEQGRRCDPLLALLARADGASVWDGVGLRVCDRLGIFSSHFLISLFLAKLKGPRGLPRIWTKLAANEPEQPPAAHLSRELRTLSREQKKPETTKTTKHAGKHHISNHITMIELYQPDPLPPSPLRLMPGYI